MAKLIFSKVIADYIVNNIPMVHIDGRNPFRNLISGGIRTFCKKLKAKSKNADSIDEQKNLDEILAIIKNLE